MSRISRESPIDIALDEELIGIVTLDRMEEMLDAIMPRYIILKPSLCGGFGKSVIMDKRGRQARHRPVGDIGTRIQRGA